ncbi:MAG: glycine--tRNA ligase subunit beta [Acidobacteria bacterium]|nr:MAG: glycine--tRNA ligase subunit beta [Acidobacteriota bacterium]
MLSNTAPLLIEIGCEELPAAAVQSLAESLLQNLMQRLLDAHLTEGAPESSAWTPRRLIFRHPAIHLRQPQSEEIIAGPPVRIAFKPDGSLSAQGAGFAAKNGVSPEALFRQTTPKGEYLAVRKKTGGGAASTLLLDLIPEAIRAIPLPRSMRWDGELRFLRPVRWLLALHGETLIPFRLGSLTAAAESRGHRTLGKPRFAVASANDYPARWKKNFVIPSPADRYAAIFGPTRVPFQREDIELENTLVNLTEWPSTIVGEFDPAYLKTLPADVLITVMRDHQKYLAVGDGSGNLAPKFIAVLNQNSDPKGLIRHGNERVLRARFSDAQFFFDTDRKRSLRDRLPLLDQVTFQAKLGSYGAKAKRMQTLAAALGGNADAQQGALLAKCDLTTEMVKEFPELQGIMGGHYAHAEGLPETVATAIADQYRWDTPPRSREGAVVSLADKLDTIAGMFALGEIPTGSADPFALRRQGNGIIRTLVECQLPLSLRHAVEQTLAGYGAIAEFHPAAETLAATAAFFTERLSFYLRDARGASTNQAVAVLASGADIPLDAAQRLAALQKAPDLAAVAAVVKRARSIVRKEGGLDKWIAQGLAQPLDPAALTQPAAQALYAAVKSLPESQDYAAELQAIASLALPLERFFTEVRVNDPDPALRATRLSLLASTVARLNRIADFAELAVS